MNRNEFATLLTTFGASIDRWPETQHADARSLLSAAPDLRASLIETREFDAAIAEARPSISEARVAELKARILARTRRATPTARMFEWLKAQEPTSIAAGIILALTVASVVERTRTAPTVNPVVELLESESSSLGVL